MHPEIQCRVHNGPPHGPFMSQINPIHTIVLYFYKMRSSIVIFTDGVKTHKHAFAFGVSVTILYKSLFIQACYMPRNLYLQELKLLLNF
jgi:hypothetical protein